MMILYTKSTCPYCHKVLDYLDRVGINIEIHDVYEKNQYMNELLTIGKKRQIPCLVQGDGALYESDDIIDWFNKHYS